MILLDTHVLVWWLSQPSKLSGPARRAIEVQARRGPVLASAISVFELATLVRRGRLKLTVSFSDWLSSARALPELAFEPVTDEIAEVAGNFGDVIHGDPADRLIAATAVVLRARLVTADEALAALPGIEAVW